jgi:tRNA 2-selenouridine synthase
MTPSIIHIEDALKDREKYTWIDARSESEFLKGHLPGAINVPLLNNEERKEIGIAYKTLGRSAAVKLGLALVGPKMSELYGIYESLAKEKPLLFYCWRGGLRSLISSTLFQWSGHKVYRLNGGYKAYRQWSQEQFQRPFKYIVLSGATGSGKTEILHLLHDQGIQIIDLEGLANHKGSAFGGLGKPAQPSTEAFENLLAEKLSELTIDRPVVFENESRLIGTCFLPQPIWDGLQTGPIIQLNVTLERRLERLSNEYGGFSRDLLIDKIQAISKKLGGQHAKSAQEMVVSGDTKGWIEAVLVYYDKTYSYSAEKNKERTKLLDFEWETEESIMSSTNAIIELIKELY